MALDNFRRVNFKIDRANDNFIDTIYAKVGDQDGRELVVQLTNNGVVEDQTGVQLKLAWTHSTIKNKGFNSFKPLDFAQGIFSVSLSPEMMNAGQLDAVIQILDDGRITNTRNFKIVVENSPLGILAVVDSDSFTALNDALLEVNQYKATVTEVEKARDQFPSLNDRIEKTGYVFETIADLQNNKRAYEFTEGTVVEILGLTTKDDGCGRKYQMSSTKRLGGVRVGNIFANPISRPSNFNYSGYAAHRGLSKLYPENSLISYEKATDYDIWELDPHYLPKSNIWINMHDMTLDRTTTGTGNTQDATIEYINSIEIKGDLPQKIPTVKDILACAMNKPKKPLIIMDSRSVVNSTNSGALEALIELVDFYQGDILFWTPDTESWVAIHNERPNVFVGLPMYYAPSDAELEGYRNFGNVILGISNNNLTEDVAKRIKVKGIPFMVFTVNNANDAKRLKSWGADVILTDILKGNV